jgi:hypothetical protein
MLASEAIGLVLGQERDRDPFGPLHLAAAQIPAEKHRLVGGKAAIQLLGVSSKPGRFRTAFGRGELLVFEQGRRLPL